MKPVPATYVSRLRTEVGRLSANHAVPLLVQLQLTHRCNLRCPDCPFAAGADPNAELDLHEVDKILAELSAVGTLYLLLSGGEILLRHDFYEIAHRARKKGFLVVLSTTGSLIGPAEADRLKEISPLKVAVNLLGPSPGAHDWRTRVPGSFHRTIAGIRHLCERGIQVLVQKPRRDHRTRRRLESQNVSSRFHNLRQDWRNDRIAETPSMFPPSSTIHESMGCLCPGGSAPERDGSFSQPCAAGRAFAAISPRGDVLPCPHLHIKLGNVRTECFRRIWCSLHESALEENPLTLICHPCPFLSAPLFPCSTWPCRI